MNNLVASGDLKAAIPTINNTAACIPASENQNNFCYEGDNGGAPNNVIIYTRLQSNQSVVISNCTAANFVPYYLWSSADSNQGIVCLSTGSNPYGQGNGQGGGYNYH